jgi:hypothetical protein
LRATGAEIIEENSSWFAQHDLLLSPAHLPIPSFRQFKALPCASTGL